MSEKRSIPVWGWIAMGCGCIVLIGFVITMAGGIFVAKKAGEFVEELEENPARTAATLIVRASPELELVSSDDEAGTMTIRNRESGETATLDFDDIAKGRFTWTTDSGEKGGVTFGGEDGVRLSTTDSAGNEESVDISASAEEGLVMRGDDFETRLGGQGEIPDWVPLPRGIETQSTFSSSNAGGSAGAFTFPTEESVDDTVAFYREALEEAGYAIESASISVTEMRQETLSAENERENRKMTVIVSRGSGVEGTQVIVQFEQPTQ